VISFRGLGDKQIASSITSSNRKQFFTKSSTISHWRVFRTCMNLLQEGHKLYYRKMVTQLRDNKEMCVFHGCSFCASSVQLQYTEHNFIPTNTCTVKAACRKIETFYPRLTLRLLMSYIYGAPSKARNANVVYIWT